VALGLKPRKHLQCKYNGDVFDDVSGITSEVCLLAIAQKITATFQVGTEREAMASAMSVFQTASI